MGVNKKQWDDINSPKVGDLIYIVNRNIRKDNKIKAVYCIATDIFESRKSHGRFINMNKLVLIVGRFPFDNRLLINVLDGDSKIYITNADLVDLNGVRWQQHECHMKYRIIQRK